MLMKHLGNLASYVNCYIQNREITKKNCFNLEQKLSIIIETKDITK